jgi:hypothetical protein
MCRCRSTALISGVKCVGLGGDAEVAVAAITADMQLSKMAIQKDEPSRLGGTLACMGVMVIPEVERVKRFLDHD